MDFGLSQDQQLFQQTIRRWIEAECPTSRVRAVMESDTGHDPGLWRALATLGLTGLLVPPAYGGAGLDLLDAALAAEQLGAGAVPAPYLGATMAVLALLASGDSEEHRRWLPAIASGELVATVALAEAQDVWDADRIRTRAEGPTLVGEKTLVPCGHVADLVIVAAQDEAGPGLWLVERGAPGLAAERLRAMDMTRPVATVRFERTPALKIAAGREAIDRIRDAGLVLLAADAYGGCRRCLDMTVRYVLTREQFGQVIGAFQGVKHQLADLVTEVEPSLSLWWYAAHAWDHIPADAARHAALAKAYCCDLYDRTTRVCTELHGGIGFTWEYDLHLWFRRAIFDRAYLGGSEHHRARAAALAGW